MTQQPGVKLLAVTQSAEGWLALIEMDDSFTTHVTNAGLSLVTIKCPSPLTVNVRLASLKESARQPAKEAVDRLNRKPSAFLSAANLQLEVDEMNRRWMLPWSDPRSDPMEAMRQIAGWR